MHGVVSIHRKPWNKPFSDVHVNIVTQTLTIIIFYASESIDLRHCIILLGINGIVYCQNESSLFLMCAGIDIGAH